ncbi:lipoate--protein ligase family protein [Nostoc sp.]|uniref:lipoate--protein ligase family protein n=1 Tax=Nostoc sp. TaxID=1180 RepID=UPI002FFC377A
MKQLATESSATWRFIPTLQTSGAVQMAIDAWLFNQCENRQHPPTLRFYNWYPYALSLGHLQKQWPAEWHNLIYQGQPLNLVRRPTGGRAVLHQGDLSYALITRASTGKSWGTYENICNFLIQGWQTLGIELNYGSARRGYIHNPSCFNTATAADLVTVDGSKFIGSAQRKGRNTILQHGSMILSTDKGLFQKVFEQSAPWNTSLCNTHQEDGWIAKIVDTLTETAKRYFGIELVTQPFTDLEWQDILKLRSLYEVQSPISKL